MNEFIFEIHHLLSRNFKLSVDQLNWWFLYLSSFNFLFALINYVIFFLKQDSEVKMTQKNLRAEFLFKFSNGWMSFPYILLLGIFNILVAEYCYNQNFIGTEVFFSIVSFQVIQIIFSLLKLIFPRIYSLSLLHLVCDSIPLALLLIYFKLFHENKILIAIIATIYLFKLLWLLNNFLSHRNFIKNLNFLSFNQMLSDYDQERLDTINKRIKSNLTFTGSPIVFLLIVCIWLSAPELWFAKILAILPILTFTNRRSSINSIDNRSTFISELEKINQLISLFLPIYVIFGINFETVFLLGLLFEIIGISTYQKIKLSTDLAIINLNNNFSKTLFEKIGSFLSVKMNPEFAAKNNFLSNIFSQKNQRSFGVLNNICSIYETNSNISDYYEIRERARNFILIKDSITSDRIHRIEDDFRYALNNLITVIDGYEIKGDEIDAYSIWINQNEFDYAYLRISLYSKLCDEKFEIINSEENNSGNFLSNELLKIHDKISTEAILLNLKIKELFSQEDTERLESLEGKGIFEFNNMLRQVHETPSVPLRFIQCLMIWEAVAQWMCGFLLAKSISDKEGESICEQEGWNKELSFGDFVSNLENLLKSNNNELITKRIKTFWQLKYRDKQGIELFNKILKYYRWSDKLNSEPTIQQLFKYMNFIRNKTRGHGIPSKIDFDFYFVLEKLSVFLVHSVKELGFELFVSTNPLDFIETHEEFISTEANQSESLLKFDRLSNEIKEKWILKLSSGGCPNIYPSYLDNENEAICFPYEETLKFLDDYKTLDSVFEVFDTSTCNVLLTLEENNVIHKFSLDNFFICKSGVLFSYHGMKKNSKSFISYTTGGLIRPSFETEE